MQYDKKIYKLSGKDQENEWEQLENPNRPEKDLKQFLYENLNLAEFAWFVYGKGDLESCFQAVAEVCPVFKNSSAEQIGWGTLADFEDFFWIGFESNNGSAILLFSYSIETPFMLQKNLIYPLIKIQKPWNFGRGKQGKVPQLVAELFKEAEVEPIWFLNELKNSCPIEEGQLDAKFCSELEKIGMVQQQEHIFMMDVETQQQRKQKIILSVMDKEYFKLSSPILFCSNGAVPERFLNKEFDEFYLELLTDELLVLSKLVPKEPERPLLEELHQQMISLASYADSVELFGNKTDVF